MKKIIYMVVLILCASFALAESEIIATGSVLDDNNVDNVLLNQEPDPAEPGGFVDIRVKVQNTGDEFAQDTEFRLIPEYPFSLFPDDDGVRELGTLYARQQGADGAILFFRLRVDEDAVEGNNKLRIQYRTNMYDWITLPAFDVMVRSRDSILSIVSATTEPEVVAPGSKTKLNIKLKNMADSLLKDIKVSIGIYTATATTTGISTFELPFTPIGSSDEKFIKKLDTNEIGDFEFDLIIDSDAESQVYKLPVYISYADEVGENYSKANIVGVVVGSEPVISVIVESTDLMFAGQTGDVSIKFVNKDITDVKYLNLKLVPGKDYEVLGAAEEYLGNIDSDDYESAEFKIHVSDDAEKRVMLPVQYTYKDANNNEYTATAQLELRLYTSSEAKKMGLVKSSSFVWVFLLIILAVGGYFVYRWYKKKKK